MLCHCCRVHVTPTRPRTMWKIALVGFWAGSMIISTLFSLALGLNLLLAPAAIFIGCAIGTSARRLNSWTCPRCSTELIEPQTTPAPAAFVIPTDLHEEEETQRLLGLRPLPQPV
jgi:hypothetical protein